ncbi:MAG: hypothetical protein J6B89_02970 [Bacilli bacterium]|nr:hypothetical protein [Bacilli bacterium]
MKITFNKKSINTSIYTNLIDRFKLYRFKLENIKEGICLPKKRKSNTYLFCQRVDIILTDDEFKVIKIIRNLKSEKFIFGNKLVYYIFILPKGTFPNIKKSDHIKVKLTTEEQTTLDNYNNKHINKYIKRKNKILKKINKKQQKKDAK